jgi:hypothetical protein
MDDGDIDPWSVSRSGEQWKFLCWDDDRARSN